MKISGMEIHTANNGHYVVPTDQLLPLSKLVKIQAQILKRFPTATHISVSCDEFMGNIILSWQVK